MASLYIVQFNRLRKRVVKASSDIAVLFLFCFVSKRQMLACYQMPATSFLPASLAVLPGCSPCCPKDGWWSAGPCSSPPRRQTGFKVTQQLALTPGQSSHHTRLKGYHRVCHCPQGSLGTGPAPQENGQSHSRPEWGEGGHPPAEQQLCHLLVPCTGQSGPAPLGEGPVRCHFLR